MNNREYEEYYVEEKTDYSASLIAFGCFVLVLLVNLFV